MLVCSCIPTPPSRSQRQDLNGGQVALYMLQLHPGHPSVPVQNYQHSHFTTNVKLNCFHSEIKEHQ